MIRDRPPEVRRRNIGLQHIWNAIKAACALGELPRRVHRARGAHPHRRLATPNVRRCLQEFSRHRRLPETETFAAPFRTRCTTSPTTTWTPPHSSRPSIGTTTPGRFAVLASPSLWARRAPQAPALPSRPSRAAPPATRPTLRSRLPRQCPMSPWPPPLARRDRHSPPMVTSLAPLGRHCMQNLGPRPPSHPPVPDVPWDASDGSAVCPIRGHRALSCWCSQLKARHGVARTKDRALCGPSAPAPRDDSKHGVHEDAVIPRPCSSRMVANLMPPTPIQPMHCGAIGARGFPTPPAFVTLRPSRSCSTQSLPTYACKPLGLPEEFSAYLAASPDSALGPHGLCCSCGSQAGPGAAHIVHRCYLAPQLPARLLHGHGTAIGPRWCSSQSLCPWMAPPCFARPGPASAH